jgi:anti-anti-sigma factor
MKNENLQVTQEIKDGVCRFFAKGRVDSNNADELEEKIINLINEGFKTIVLNMSQVEYLSSIGIRVVLKIYKITKEQGGTFNIEKPSDIVRNVLGMVALEEMLVTG